MQIENPQLQNNLIPRGGKLEQKEPSQDRAKRKILAGDSAGS
jgi:enterochelin esterase-like enzyme